MHLGFTEDEIAFRNEVRGFIDTSLPGEIRARLARGEAPSREDTITWQRILNARGWAVPAWPVEWGGTDWTAVQRLIFLDELSAAPAPDPLPFNVTMVGPVLYTFGSEAQKRRFLPRAANLDDWWCQGFSEPGAGSDLASLRTTATRDGDHYIVTGQKLWTTYAQYADWMFCLVRTDPAAKQQEGISFLLIDMKSPGITIRPVITLDRRHHVNEVFLDEVRVPVEHRVGEENRGWDYAKFLLGNERTGIARVGRSKERLRYAVSLARAQGRLSADQVLRERIAWLEVELQALDITQMRVVAAPKVAGKPDPASSVLKIKGTELQQAVAELLLDIAGPEALTLATGDARESNEPDWAAPIATGYFYSRVTSIYGGSNEIQKNILAQTVLGRGVR
jgi:alkylation response protein AidB-like acyl-CoA dehydrogenase